MEDRLVIDVSRLAPEGERIAGEVDCIGLDEEFVKPFGGVRYDLFAQCFGTELLVRGSLEQDFDLVCSRCGGDFDDTVRVEDFTASVDAGEDAREVDITSELRDSVILALPNYPVCSETCPGVERKQKPISDDRWNVLDSLKQEGGKANG